METFPHLWIILNLSTVLREIICEIGYSVFYTSVNYPLSYYVFTCIQPETWNCVCLAMANLIIR